MLYVILFLLSLASSAYAAEPAHPLTAVHVSSVYDGDTFTLEDKLIPSMPWLTWHVRIAGIDTPERKGSCFAERGLADEARRTLQSAIDHANGVVFISVVDHDKYGGRLDAVVYIDGINIGDRLVSLGLARHYDGGEKSSWCD